MAVNVFVSYSHDDAALVTPIVKLLRVNKALVFHYLKEGEQNGHNQSTVGDKRS